MQMRTADPPPLAKDDNVSWVGRAHLWAGRALAQRGRTREALGELLLVKCAGFERKRVGR